MANGKSGAGKSAAGKSAGAKSKATKPAAKPAAKAAAKSNGKAAKPVSKATKPAAPAKAAKPTKAAPLKVVEKAAAKAKPEKAAKSEKEAKLTAKAKPEKAPKSNGKGAEPKADAKAKLKLVKSNPAEEEAVGESDFAETDEFAADLAQDLASVDEDSGAEPEAAAPSPSSSLLQAMKPTPPEDKSAEKKKKKDDLKIDRNGDLEAQWQTLKDKNKAIKPLNYKMSESFEARTPILHKVLGWGFIIGNQNDRLEVLFQQGIKFLISNYKA